MVNVFQHLANKSVGEYPTREQYGHILLTEKGKAQDNARKIDFHHDKLLIVGFRADDQELGEAFLSASIWSRMQAVDRATFTQGYTSVGHSSSIDARKPEEIKVDGMAMSLKDLRRRDAQLKKIVNLLAKMERGEKTSQTPTNNLETKYPNATRSIQHFLVPAAVVSSYAGAELVSNWMIQTVLVSAGIVFAGFTFSSIHQSVRRVRANMAVDKFKKIVANVTDENKQTDDAEANDAKENRKSIKDRVLKFVQLVQKLEID